MLWEMNPLFNFSQIITHTFYQLVTQLVGTVNNKSRLAISVCECFLSGFGNISNFSLQIVMGQDGS